MKTRAGTRKRNRRGHSWARPGFSPIFAHMRLVLLITLIVGSSPAVAQSSATLLHDRVATRIAQVPGAFVGLLYRRVGSADRIAINADTLFHAASTMKVPVMIEFFRRVEAGGLRADQPVLLVNQFGSIVDGSPYALDPVDDSDSATYKHVGQRVPARELVERMITRSSNLATNAVIALLGADVVTRTARALGAPTISVLRGVEDGKAFQRGLNNMTSARDLAVLLEAIEMRRAASFASCDTMLGILRRQEFNDQIPAGLPPGTIVAHKTGSITGVLHDAAIVYPTGESPYLLVVLTRGIPSEKVASALIADISRMVWEDATARIHH